jgi:hypothetical protein
VKSKNALVSIADIESKNIIFYTNYKRVPGFSRKCKSKDYLRYFIWLALANTAKANHRRFGMATTWVPHLLGNSIALLLPEIYQVVDQLFDLGNRLEPHPDLSALLASFEQLVRDNPNYVDYVAPAALAYVVSHPRFNIYRGEWGDLNLLGFGLDSIPHSMTAYALSKLVYDTIETVEANLQADMLVWPPVKWMANHKDLVSGAVIALLTLGYETSEYLIYKAELRARDHDISQINMMWSLRDTIFDVLSNCIGWAVAAWLRPTSKTRF